MRKETDLFSQFLDSTREILTDLEISKIIHYLKVFIMVHYLKLIAQARKNFRLQSDDETLLADETDFMLNPEWTIFLNIPYEWSNCNDFRR